MNKNADVLYLSIYVKAVFMFVRLNDRQHQKEAQFPNAPNAKNEIHEDTIRNGLTGGSTLCRPG